MARPQILMPNRVLPPGTVGKEIPIKDSNFMVRNPRM